MAAIVVYPDPFTFLSTLGCIISPILQMRKLIDGHEEVPGEHRGRSYQLHKGQSGSVHRGSHMSFTQPFI